MYDGATTPVWTPLRFPGHYYDSETDLFENWHRFYDPSTGRYLQPEPLIQPIPSVTPDALLSGSLNPTTSGGPDDVLSFAQNGAFMPAYTYAGADPIDVSDSDGLSSTRWNDGKPPPFPKNDIWPHPPATRDSCYARCRALYDRGLNDLANDVAEIKSKQAEACELKTGPNRLLNQIMDAAQRQAFRSRANSALKRMRANCYVTCNTLFP
jgi:hypothetical protein